MSSLADLYRSAVSAYGRGDFAGARRDAEQILKLRPREPSVLQLIGISLCQDERPAEGADFLRRAIAAGADTPDNRLNLVQALVSAGDHDGALVILNGPDAGKPEFERLRADLMKAKGRPGDAVMLYERLVHERPDDFAAWNNLGNARHAAGDLGGALDALQRATQLDPKSAQVHTNLGRVLVSLDRHKDACLVLEQAALLSPGRSAPLLELGELLTRLDHPEAALRALGDAGRIDQRNPAIFGAIGTAFTAAENPGQAETAFRMALGLDPRNAVAILNLGLLFEQANRLDDLTELVATARAGNAAPAELAYLDALIDFRAGKLEAAEDRLRRLKIETVAPGVVSHLLGQIADRRGDVSGAARHVEAMNRDAADSPLAVGVDRTAYRRAVEGMAARLTPEYVAAWAPAPVVESPSAPAFLVGFPRSGTTLLDTFLLGQGRTHVLEETPIMEGIARTGGAFDRLADLNADEVLSLRQRYFADLARLAPAPDGTQLVIDKNPLALTRIPLIHRLFPDARIILAMRHPADVVLSCWMQNFKPTEAMASFLDLHSAALLYDRVFAFWAKCEQAFPLNVHLLRYEDMIADPQAALRPAIDFLGLEWDDGLLAHQRTAQARGRIRTPSYAQVTERLYQSANGRWTRYRDQLRDILPILAPWADRYGYDLGAH